MQADAVDLSQAMDVVAVLGELMELLLDAFDVLFEPEDIIEQSRESGAQWVGHDTVIENDTHLAFGIGGTLNADQIERARRIIRTFEEADTGLVVIDGKLIEKAVLRDMHRILAIADRVSA